MNIIVFFVADKEYGLDISQVREAIQFRSAIPVPDTADFVEGVITWHGQVIPLVSFRKKIKLSDQAHDHLNRILITQIGETFVGVIVDRIGSVEKFDEAQITAPDEMLKEAVYLVGVAKKEDRIILMIDMQKFLNVEEQSSIAHIHNRVEVKKKKTNE